ncbi:MAG: aromatic ring-hydroxylating dioxygenase subunit alpha [Alphaproteobacteria bacterium]|nr:aromatic ring-hydroxylating dioxygenase subunit alpha [Alphaproteobacteria bacterium]
MSQLLQATQPARRPSALADRSTPFIFNCWYMAGFAGEIGRTLLARTILGRPLVLYRTEAGKPVALDDRCLHRSFPLSKSLLDGDTIVCGYHGMRYDCRGRCLEVPSQKHTPQGLGVRSYQTVERGPLVWIWMGDEAGDESLIPDIDDWTANAAWIGSRGYIPLKASYIALHENLLDLSHLSYLHRNSFGTPDYAKASFRVETDEDNGRFALLRDVVPTRLPPIWAKPTGLEGVDAARIVRSEFCGPSLHVVQVAFYGLDFPEDQRPDQMVRTAHLVTPETATSTHYFLYHARNFALDVSGVTEFMHQSLFKAFEEDRNGLEAVEAMIGACGGDVSEVSFTADRANLAMRRYLKRRAEAEAAARSVSTI